jgi:hypothetical protein
MKKLFITLFLVLSISQVMAMGYPQNIILQRKALIQKSSVKSIIKRTVTKIQPKISTQKVVMMGVYKFLFNL